MVQLGNLRKTWLMEPRHMIILSPNGVRAAKKERRFNAVRIVAISSGDRRGQWVRRSKPVTEAQHRRLPAKLMLNTS